MPFLESASREKGKEGTGKNKSESKSVLFHCPRTYTKYKNRLPTENESEAVSNRVTLKKKKKKKKT